MHHPSITIKFITDANAFQGSMVLVSVDAIPRRSRLSTM